MEFKIATGIYFKPTEKAVLTLKATALAGVALVSLASVYAGFNYYGSMKNGNSFGPDTIKSHFYMNEVQKAKLPSETIIKK